MTWAIFILLLGATQVHAEERFEMIRDFSGGLNTRLPSFRLPTVFSPYMRNVLIDNGKVEGINGYIAVGSSNGVVNQLQKVTGIFPYIIENGTKKFLVTDSSVTLETSDFRSWVLVSSGNATTTLMTWMQVRDKMWGFNGVDSVMTWDGTTRKFLNGGAGVPNVPRFRYGAFWQERVWGFNDSNGKSDLSFTSLSSTDGVIIAPDDSRAWPDTNVLRVGQGDGEYGSALWIKDGQLRAGKDRSIYTIYGTNVSNYFARKDSTIDDGVVSNETIVNLDGSSYWLGNYGIYKDGVRISDDIEDEVESIEKPSNNVVQASWDIQSDFARGQFAGTTATAAGFLQSQQRTLRVNTAESSPSGPGFIQFVGTGVFDTGFTTLTVGSNVPADFVGDPVEMRLWGRRNSLCGGVTIEVTYKNLRRGTVSSSPQRSDWLTSTFTFTGVVIPDFTGEEFDAAEINNSSIGVRVRAVGNLASGCVFEFYPASGTNQTTLDMSASSDTQFISDIATFTSVTAWGLFDSVRNTNQGTISFFIRAGTSPVNVATQTWSAIVPGVIPNLPTSYNYFQWASSFTGDATNPNIDSVLIEHVEGEGSLNRAFAIGWKGRYLLFTSTVSGNDTLSFGLWKAKYTNANPNAWMPVEGINIRAIAKDGDTLYAGSASTGAIYRLDFGTNFDGSTISYTYDTPDLVLGDNYRSKTIQRYLMDADRDSGLSYSVGSSIDGGVFTTTSHSFAGSGRGLRVIKGVVAQAKTLRLRISHSQLDRRFGLNDLTVGYNLSEVLEPK